MKIKFRKFSYLFCPEESLVSMLLF